MLLGLAGAAATLSLGATRAAAPSATAGPLSAAARKRLVDVHHHMFSPRMLDFLKDRLGNGVTMPGADRSLQELDQGGVATAMISSPNSDITELPESELVSLVRDSNDHAMNVLQRERGRYGLFASLPLPHVDASLREIERVFDELHVDGVMLITNYGDRWLGDPRLAPVLDELNRRKAVVYTHPNAANCCKGLLQGLNDSIIEFETDTARTIASLLFTGTAERCPDIRFIFSHAGGTMPALIERFTMAVRGAPALAQKVPRGALAYLQSFHYDTAQAANPSALGALLKFVPDRQVMFGTDFPYRHVPDQLGAIEAMQLGDVATAGIMSGNARRLLERLRA